MCGQPSANIVSPRKEWGTLYDGLELERACDRVDPSGDADYAFDPRDGRETFECPCGQAIWIEDRHDVSSAHSGGWFSRVKTKNSQP
jgi:hypothetical protein